jgi:hypothetical protein
LITFMVGGKSTSMESSSLQAGPGQARPYTRQCCSNLQIEMYRGIPGLYQNE